MITFAFTVLILFQANPNHAEITSQRTNSFILRGEVIKQICFTFVANFFQICDGKFLRCIFLEN